MIEGSNDGRQYRGRAPVQLPAPVVGHDDALDAVLHRQLGVLLGQDAFDNDRQAGDGLQPVDVLPADRRVQGVGRDPVLLWHCRPKGILEKADVKPLLLRFYRTAALASIELLLCLSKQV